MGSSFINPILSSVPMVSAKTMMGNAILGRNATLGSFQPVQTGMDPIRLLLSYPSYGVGMKPVASVGLIVPMSARFD